MRLDARGAVGLSLSLPDSIPASRFNGAARGELQAERTGVTLLGNRPNFGHVPMSDIWQIKLGWRIRAWVLRNDGKCSPRDYIGWRNYFDHRRQIHHMALVSFGRSTMAG